MKNISFILLLCLILLYFGAVFFVSNSISSFFGGTNLWLYYIVIIFLSLYSTFSVAYFSEKRGQWAKINFIAGSYLLGLLLNTALVTILLKLFLLFTHISQVTLGIVIMVLSLILTLYEIWKAAHIEITRYRIPLKKAVSPLRIAHLSDMHLGHCRSTGFVYKIIKKVNQQKVDAICFTGDFIEGDSVLIQSNFNILSCLDIPVFFVDGNHDEHGSLTIEYNMLKNNGITVLDNQMTTFNNYQFIGISNTIPDESFRNRHTKSPSMKEVLSTITIDHKKPSILLHHIPWGINYVVDKGIDVFLSGHTHGGQIFPVHIFGKLMYHYLKGIHHINGTTLVVSQGLGTFGPPMRLFSKSEIVIIDFIPLQSQ